MNKVERTIKEVAIYPDHVNRTESEEFRKNKERLKLDGHFKCYICGAENNLEVHHYGCEWAFSEDCDYSKLKEFCEDFDPYGYGRLLRNLSIISPDDIRNLLVICERHHRATENGVHETTMPIWIIQKLAKSGTEPVPEQ